VHGAVAAQNVFVEPSGRALVSDFGLGSEGATQDSDRAAFAALVRECLGDRLPAPVTPPPSSAAAIVGSAAGALPERRTPRWLWKAIVAVVAGAAALAATGVLLAGSEDEPEPAPPVLQGAQALGSALPATGVEPLDCNGRPPTGASPLCTLVQTRLPGRPVIPRRDGAIRRWTVRGARGVLALQVLRRRGGMFVSTARTRYEQIPDEGVHAFQADLPIREGDEVGVQVAPGAAIGVRRDVRGAQTARSFGPLTRTALPVERGERSGFGEEVLLRVEYLPGAEPDLPGRLTGRAAKQAPAGQQLAALDVKPPDGPVRRTSVVRVGDRIAVDLFQRERRITRLPVAGADARGRLLSVNTHGEPTVYLRWRNPDGRTISHDYAVSSRSMTPSS